VGAVTIDAFQQLFVELATEAVFTAVEKGVFNGTGTGQMLGICKDTRITNAVEMTADEFGKWDAWKKKVFAKIREICHRLDL
jgi:HK97 family phage major capsid protein